MPNVTLNGFTIILADVHCLVRDAPSNKDRPPEPKALLLCINSAERCQRELTCGVLLDGFPCLLELVSGSGLRSSGNKSTGAHDRSPSGGPGKGLEHGGQFSLASGFVQ